MRRERLGVFGGTFDPPHLGHLSAATVFLREAALDRLLIIPDCIPPHKQLSGAATGEDRLRMAELAFSHLPHTEVSDMELCRGGRSYTVDTLSALADGARDLYLLCGTDMFLTLPSWRSPERIFALATVCCIRREESEEDGEAILRAAERYQREYGASVRLLSAPPLPLSSRELRSRLAPQDESAEALLPAGVLSYIRERGLYR